MEYRLLRADADGSIVATSDKMNGELEAMVWARNWLKKHAGSDRYRLEPPAGDRPLLMVRTIAGQWYAIPIAVAR